MQTNHPITLICPYCGKRPADTISTVSWVRGFIIFFTLKSNDLVGCRECVRGKLLSEVGDSLLLGWFSIPSIFINPFLIVSNLFKSLTLKPNPDAVIHHENALDYEADPNSLSGLPRPSLQAIFTWFAIAFVMYIYILILMTR